MIVIHLVRTTTTTSTTLPPLSHTPTPTHPPTTTHPPHGSCFFSDLVFMRQVLSLERMLRVRSAQQASSVQSAQGGGDVGSVHEARTSELGAETVFNDTRLERRRLRSVGESDFKGVVYSGWPLARPACSAGEKALKDSVSESGCRGGEHVLKDAVSEPWFGLNRAGVIALGMRWRQAPPPPPQAPPPSSSPSSPSLSPSSSYPLSLPLHPTLHTPHTTPRAAACAAQRRPPLPLHTYRPQSGRRLSVAARIISSKLKRRIEEVKSVPTHDPHQQGREH